jgi:hypothetical protein
MGGGGEGAPRGVPHQPSRMPPVVSPQQQAILESSRGSNPQPPGQPGVRYANDCEIIVTAKAQQYVIYIYFFKVQFSTTFINI